MYRSLGGKPQAAEFVAVRRARGPGDAALVLRLLDKMGRGKEPEAGSVPEKGDRVCFTLFEHDQRRRRRSCPTRRTPRGRTAARRATGPPATPGPYRYLSSRIR